MKKLVASAAVLVLSAAALVGTRDAYSAPESTAWQGDTVHSFVLFKVKHMGASSAYGRFNQFTVAVGANEDGSAVSSVEFAVKAQSIDTGNAGRDKHLMSPDFLNAKQFEEITFKSTAVKGDEVTGDLTLHGVTKPVTAKLVKVGAAKGMKGEELVGYETTFTVKRSDFGMTNLVGPVSDEVTITVATELSKK
jgi:polyisoprenoid-binding protein YceI